MCPLVHSTVSPRTKACADLITGIVEEVPAMGQQLVATMMGAREVSRPPSPPPSHTVDILARSVPARVGTVATEHLHSWSEIGSALWCRASRVVRRRRRPGTGDRATITRQERAPVPLVGDLDYRAHQRGESPAATVATQLAGAVESSSSDGSERCESRAAPRARDTPVASFRAGRSALAEETTGLIARWAWQRLWFWTQPTAGAMGSRHSDRSSRVVRSAPSRAGRETLASTLSASAPHCGIQHARRWCHAAVETYLRYVWYWT